LADVEVARSRHDGTPPATVAASADVSSGYRSGRWSMVASVCAPSSASPAGGVNVARGILLASLAANGSISSAPAANRRPVHDTGTSASERPTRPHAAAAA